MKESTWNGIKYRSITDAAKNADEGRGISVQLLRTRLNRGWVCDSDVKHKPLYKQKKLRNGVRISDRELEVLQLRFNKTIPEIAEKLYLTENTVKLHMHHIRQAIGVTTTVEACVWAFNNGLIV